MSIKRHPGGKLFSAAVQHNGVVYVAGQVADDLSLDVGGQTGQVLKKIDALLAASGTSKAKLLSANVWLTDIRNRDEMNAAWTAWADPPGGRLLVLEFSQVWRPLAKAYDWYSFKMLPWLGRKVAGDEAAYRYLAESIRVHPNQESLKKMMEQAGLGGVEYFNLSAGVAALHRGFKF